MSKTTKNNNSKIEQRPPKKKSERTPHYDEIGAKIKKLLTATGATYIPELGDALAEDWYPDFPKETLQQWSEVREGIIEKVLYDYSEEHADDGVWKTSSIIHWLPFWLRDPLDLERGKLSLESRRAKKFSADVSEKRKLMERLVEQLPEPPQEPHRQVSEITDDSQMRSITDDDPLFRKLGDTGRDVIGQYGNIFGPMQDLIEGLTDKRWIPRADEDRFNEYIKPSRERFMTVYHEVEKRMQVDLYNGFVYLKELLEDRVHLIDSARRK